MQILIMPWPCALSRLSVKVIFDKDSSVNSSQSVGTQSALSYSKLTMETLEQGVKYVQS